MLQPISSCCHYSIGSSAENLTILQLISSINCERMATDNCGDKFRTLRGHCSNHQILLERNCSLTDRDLISLAEDLRMLLLGGWQVVPLSWVVEQRLGMANRDLAKCVAITCDDGCDLEVLDVDYPGRGIQRSFLGCLQDARNDFPDSGSEFQITSFVIADPKARQLLDEKCLHSLGWMSENWWREASRNDLFSIECHGWDHNHDILDNDAPDGMTVLYAPRSQTIPQSVRRASRQVWQAADLPPSLPFDILRSELRSTARRTTFCKWGWMTAIDSYWNWWNDRLRQGSAGNHRFAWWKRWGCL